LLGEKFPNERLRPRRNGDALRACARPRYPSPRSNQKNDGKVASARRRGCASFQGTVRRSDSPAPRAYDFSASNLPGWRCCSSRWEDWPGLGARPPSLEKGPQKVMAVTVEKWKSEPVSQGPDPITTVDAVLLRHESRQSGAGWSWNGLRRWAGHRAGRINDGQLHGVWTCTAVGRHLETRRKSSFC